jgi:hypothetical protein
MLRAKVCRDRAAECRQLACNASRPSHREELLKLAEAWDELAQHRENFLVRKLFGREALRTFATKENRQS